MITRTKYSKEFKRDAISLVNEQGYSRKAASESLGIDYQLMCRWIKEASKDEGQAFRGQGKLTAEQDILNYITMFYNSSRLHSTLDYTTPNQYEWQMAVLEKVA